MNFVLLQTEIQSRFRIDVVAINWVNLKFSKKAIESRLDCRQWVLSLEKGNKSVLIPVDVLKRAVNLIEAFFLVKPRRSDPDDL
jgi:hypothetical protein